MFRVFWIRLWWYLKIFKNERKEENTTTKTFTFTSISETKIIVISFPKQKLLLKWEGTCFVPLRFIFFSVVKKIPLPALLFSKLLKHNYGSNNHLEEKLFWKLSYIFHWVFSQLSLDLYVKLRSIKDFISCS